jgi:hypothetical protein
MLFTSKPTAIAYLQRDALTIHTYQTDFRFEHTPDLVQNLEILDPKKLHQTLTQFLQTNQIHSQRVLLVLADSVIFQKNLPLTKTTDPQAALADFQAKLPFAPESRQTLAFTQPTQTILFGIGKDLCQAITEDLHQTGNKVQAIVPATLYGLTEDKKITPAILTRLISDPAPAHTANFLAKP